MTFVLVSVVYAVAIGEPSFGVMGPFAVGLALFAMVFAGKLAFVFTACITLIVFVCCKMIVFRNLLTAHLTHALAFAGVHLTLFGWWQPSSCLAPVCICATKSISNCTLIQCLTLSLCLSCCVQLADTHGVQGRSSQEQPSTLRVPWDLQLCSTATGTKCGCMLLRVSHDIQAVASCCRLAEAGPYLANILCRLQHRS